MITIMNFELYRVALCVSIATVVLFVVTWSFGLLAVYLHSAFSQQYLDYPFAIFQATFATYLFIVLCLNSKVCVRVCVCVCVGLWVCVCVCGCQTTYIIIEQKFSLSLSLC